MTHIAYDVDIWWHIAIGREIVQNGTLPGGDGWSFTAPGISYVYHSWLSGLVFYWIWTISGETGLNAFHFLIHLSTCILVYVFAKNQMDKKHALVLTCLMAFWLSTREVRSHIFSPLFMVILLGLIGDISKLGYKKCIGVLLLFLAWVNLHGGFIVGWIVLSVFAGGCILAFIFSKQKEIPAKYFFALSALSFAVTLMNPYSFDVYSSIVQGVHNQSFDWLNISLNPLSVSVPTAVSLICSALFLAWYVTYVINNKHGVELPFLLMGLASYAMLLTAQRLEWMLFIPLWILFKNYPVLKQDLTALLPKVLKPFMQERAVMIRMAVFYAAILAVFTPYVYGRVNHADRHWYEGFPVEIEDYITENQLTGNVFCPLTWSGKITLITNGNLKIYIDGRLLLYPSHFFLDYLDILHRRGLTASQIQSYEIDYLLLPIEVVDTFMAASAPIRWKPIKVAGNTVLFKHETNETAGRLPFSKTKKTQ